MRVAPGQIIPLFLKIADGSGSRFVLAHVTRLNGSPYLTSPYPLSYSGSRGIYTGNGPIIGIENLVVDYQVYLDEDFLILDRSQLPNLELVESDISNIDAVTIILSSLSGSSQNTILGVVDQTEIRGTVSNPGEIYSEVSLDSPQFGSVESISQTGLIETTTLEGT